VRANPASLVGRCWGAQTVSQREVEQARIARELEQQQREYERSVKALLHRMEDEMAPRQEGPPPGGMSQQQPLLQPPAFGPPYFDRDAGPGAPSEKLSDARVQPGMQSARVLQGPVAASPRVDAQRPATSSAPAASGPASVPIAVLSEVGNSTLGLSSLQVALQALQLLPEGSEPYKLQMQHIQVGLRLCVSYGARAPLVSHPPAQSAPAAPSASASASLSPSFTPSSPEFDRAPV
jgi:hypothetical protein